MLNMLYGPADGNARQERKYSPNVCSGIDVKVIEGDPDLSEISTTYVERTAPCRWACAVPSA